MYTKNTFHFYDPGDIRYFGKTILPHRLNSITSMIIDWERPFSIFNKDNTVPKMDREEFKSWSESWEILRGMESLRDLRVILKPHKYEVSLARRKKMVAPMMGMTGLRKFELVIPFDDQGDWEFAKDAPFEIVRGIDMSDDADD